MAKIQNMNERVKGAIQNSTNSLFYIKTHTEDAKLQKECQKMINLLYKKFPNIMPKPEGA